VARLLVDIHGPKQASRIFAKVLGHIETRGLDAVANRLQVALQDNEPLLLALAAPSSPAPELAHDALPQSLRNVEVAAGCAADYDRILIGAES